MLSIIIPVYNEEACLPELVRRLEAVAAPLGSYELVFINDGSKDGTLEGLRGLRKKNSRIRILDFSRNFGHQIAVKAGLDHSTGDYIVIIDADLQDPPEVIPQMVEKAKEGYDVVYAVRASREGESFLKKWTAEVFYKLLKSIAQVDIPTNTGDFRLMTRRAADVVRGLKEKNLYLRGLVSWIGFRQTGILIHREARFAGSTKYTWKKMFQLAWNGITNFSMLPLKFATYMGVFTTMVCAAWLLRALYVHFVLQETVPGWTSLMVAVLFLGGVQLLTLGILGSYLGKNFDESRGRPLYILRDKEGF
jgi:polyisoprenyl-phosphate glycosyltransferase